jgi:hypothetical protein
MLMMMNESHRYGVNNAETPGGSADSTYLVWQCGESGLLTNVVGVCGYGSGVSVGTRGGSYRGNSVGRAIPLRNSRTRARRERIWGVTIR